MRSPRFKEPKNAKLCPPPLIEPTTWMVARSCLVAMVALPTFGMSVLSGQITLEAGLDPSFLTDVVQSVDGHDALHELAGGPGGTVVRNGSFEPSEDAGVWSETGDGGMACIWCESAETGGEVWWHRTFGIVPLWGFQLGHGEHEWWLQGDCFSVHWFCSIFTGGQALNIRELAREISHAVAAQYVAALAGYARLPSVSLFAERSAIQILGCDGETIAGHIPVDPELLVATEVKVGQLDSEP